jgi:MFS family permease
MVHTTRVEKPRHRAPRSGTTGVVSPFNRLARTHAALIAGDTFVSLALAGSLFFSIDPSEARWRVALYLLLTIAPFAIVAPLIGPWMDRVAGGRRLLLMLGAVGKAFLAILMIRDIDGLLLFPESFALLVLGKAYSIAKSSTVPDVVPDSEGLVKANSKLALISAMGGFAAGVPGVVILRFLGPGWVLGCAAVCFLSGALLARLIPVSQDAPVHDLDDSDHQVRSEGVRRGRNTMALLRFLVGFLTFLLAFSLRGGDKEPPTGAGLGESVRVGLGSPELSSTSSPTWHFGVVLAAFAIGSLLASFIAPRLRDRLREDSILQAMLGLAMLVGFLGAITGSILGGAVVSFGIGFASTAGKQAFDALVQRDVPAADHGRLFASFESRFQLTWVVGAAIPVLLLMPARLGYGLMALFAFAGLVIYLLDVAGRLDAITGLLGNRKASSGEPTEAAAAAPAGAPPVQPPAQPPAHTAAPSPAQPTMVRPAAPGPPVDEPTAEMPAVVVPDNYGAAGGFRPEPAPGWPTSQPTPPAPQSPPRAPEPPPPPPPAPAATPAPPPPPPAHAATPQMATSVSREDAVDPPSWVTRALDRRRAEAGEGEPPVT